MTDPFVAPDPETLTTELGRLLLWEQAPNESVRAYASRLVDALIASGAVVPAVKHHKQIAQAWDEGFTAGVNDGADAVVSVSEDRAMREFSTNPYRAALTPKGPADE